jgi:hypothetical protein
MIINAVIEPVAQAPNVPTERENDFFIFFADQSSPWASTSALTANEPLVYIISIELMFSIPSRQKCDTFNNATNTS